MTDWWKSSDDVKAEWFLVEIVLASFGVEDGRAVAILSEVASSHQSITTVISWPTSNQNSATIFERLETVHW
jgi:hypothetical protein